MKFAALGVLAVVIGVALMYSPSLLLSTGNQIPVQTNTTNSGLETTQSNILVNNSAHADGVSFLTMATNFSIVIISALTAGVLSFLVVKRVTKPNRL